MSTTTSQSSGRQVLVDSKNKQTTDDVRVDWRGTVAGGVTAPYPVTGRSVAHDDQCVSRFGQTTPKKTKKKGRKELLLPNITDTIFHFNYDVNTLNSTGQGVAFGADAPHCTAPVAQVPTREREL